MAIVDIAVSRQPQDRGAVMAKPRFVIAANELRTLVAATLTAVGMSDDDAKTATEAFVWANLRGVDSHGVSRVPRYLQLFDKGEANPRPQIRVERVRSATLLVDADQAPGPVALTRAMREAIAVARETGVAWATVRGTVHTGAIGYYTALAAAEGFAAIGMVAGVPNMAYHGTRGAGVATSPLSIAVPAARHAPLVLDMATAAIALGKIAQYRINGRPLPADAALTADGEPTTDPAVAKIPTPVGGAKGSGMSLAFELLTSGLADNPIVPEYHSGSPEGRRHRQNATLIAIDVSAFMPVDAYTDIADRTIDAIKGLPAAGEEPVMYPGERGAATFAARSRDGIPLPPKTWNELAEAAASLGVAVPEPQATAV
jgi:LDH2 family malate/lactate/ureidoglycolate dehydrogenase